MRKIRDPKCGPGRLEDYRVDMLSATGERIPVTLSAALIIENDQPVGSVGIFTDIRDKLRMEARLNARPGRAARHARNRPLVAELAGAAAHELNQPLTSVIGYAELLRRNLENNAARQRRRRDHLGEPSAWRRSCARSARSRKYETKSYVGGRQDPRPRKGRR